MSRRRLLFVPLAVAAGALLAALPFCARRLSLPSASRPAPQLPRLIESLSEPGGFFDSDNIISNEISYLQVSEALEQRAGAGGAYIGVGPDQNFTYIGQLRPSWAFIVDIRRQNMLQHLLFNAIFEKAETSYQYLCRLFSRPDSVLELRASQRGLAALLSAVESAEPSPEAFERNLEEIVKHVEHKLRVSLAAEDRSTLRAIYRTFFEGQLELRFRSYGRPAMPYHPTYRDLLTARSPSGEDGHFLASAEDYRYVRDLERAGRVVPVVGDFAGPYALRAIGKFLEEQGETVSAFYVSNVEFYLLRSGRYHQFVANVKELPLREDSLFIRSYFDYGLAHPASLPGYRSTTILQRVPRFLALYQSGVYRSYWDVCTIDYLR